MRDLIAQRVLHFNIEWAVFNSYRTNIGKEKNAMAFGRYLYNKGVFAQPIRYPTVPKNKARLRLSVTAWLTLKEIEKSLEIFEQSYDKFLK